MKKRILFATLASLLLLTFGCRKDIIDFIPDPTPGVPHKANILGVVTDESNQPVAGATVTFNTLTKVTDENGVYTFHDVDVDSKHSYLTIKKAGFFDGSRTFSTNTTTSLNLHNMLLKKEFNYTFEAASGGDVSIDNVNLSFPAGAIKVQSSGVTYNGEVKVALKYLNPADRAVYQLMPGNLTGLATNNELKALATFGMVAVELQSPSGEKLNIQTGSQAELAISLPSALVSNAPASIPLWYFDEEKGYWREEGTATLDNGKYFGKVSHFSFWNCDAGFPIIQLTGKVVDENGNPIQGTAIGLSINSSGNSSIGWTSADGFFGGGVPLGETMTLSVYASASCITQAIYTAEIGPFTEDVTLDDITVTIPQEELATVNANFINCDGDPVTNGYVKITYEGQNFYFPIDNGSTNITLASCTSTSGTLLAVDETTIKASAPVELAIPGVNELGTISVCASDADHITVLSTELALNEVVIDTLILWESFEFASISGYNHSDVNGDEIGIYLNYNDGNAAGVFATGTFPVSSANINIRTNDVPYYYYTASPDPGTITITQGGSSGEVIKGTYTVTLTEEGTTNVVEFTGEFQLTAQ